MTASQRFYLLAILAIAPLAAAAWWPELAKIGLVLDVLLLVAVLIDRQLTPPASQLSASREVDARLSIGRENDVVLTLSNNGALALDCLVRDDAPEIAGAGATLHARLEPQSTVKISYRLSPKRRGAYKFGNINLRYRSKLGLFFVEKKVKVPQEIKVYSDLKALHDLSVKLSHSSELGELHQKKRGQGTDFASLRDYSAGDDSKAIDWRATARRDRPVIRTYEAEQEQRLLILVDAGRMMVSDLEGLSRFDRALNAALCLALTGLSHNDQVGIGIFADKPLLYMPPKRGKPYMHRILESTFAVEPRMVEPDYAGILSYFAQAQKGRSLMVVLTDLTDPIGSQALLSGLASLAPRHLPFCVTLKDRNVQQIAASAIRDQKDEKEQKLEIYRKAVALDLLSQRELALSVLTRRGCLILDAAPQDLSDKLVEKYLEVKARGRL